MIVLLLDAALAYCTTMRGGDRDILLRHHRPTPPAPACFSASPSAIATASNAVAMRSADIFLVSYLNDTLQCTICTFGLACATGGCPRADSQAR